MAFSKRPVTFTLKDVGSEIIDQLSTDVYTGPGAIIRELVKNAYDSYLHYTADELDDEGIERSVVISRERGEKGLGKIWVADQGIGLNVKGLRALVQISVCNKADLEDSTGFRGLGSWAVLGGGSKVVITSDKKGNPASRLIINVRKVYQKLGPTTTLDDILNDSACISFEETDASTPQHGTTVEIQCDGPPEKVNGYELNRLYSYTDPANHEFRDLVMKSCPIPFAAKYAQIAGLYERVRYFPTTIMLDGDILERKLPTQLSTFHTKEIVIGESVAAVAWFAEDRDHTGVVNKHIKEEHVLGGPGIQLLKYNVPIGPKGLFANDVRQATNSNWYVGEVHILSRDVLPDASGDDLRAGSAREIFIEKLRGFYDHLEKQAEVKSQRLSMIRKLRQGQQAAAQLATRGNSEAAKVQAKSKVLGAIEVIEAGSKREDSPTEQLRREAASDPTVKSLRQTVRSELKESGLLDELTHKKSAAKKKSRKPFKEPAKDREGYIPVNEFQARIGQALPRFAEIGLTLEQIEQVMAILNDLLVSEPVEV